jgi:hypothetical protein
MILSEAKKYRACARECLKLAEEATRRDVRERLVELSRVWMEAALSRSSITAEGHPPSRLRNSPGGGASRRGFAMECQAISQWNSAKRVPIPEPSRPRRMRIDASGRKELSSFSPWQARRSASIFRRYQQ